MAKHLALLVTLEAQRGGVASGATQPGGGWESSFFRDKETCEKPLLLKIRGTKPGSDPRRGHRAAEHSHQCSSLQRAMRALLTASRGNAAAWRSQDPFHHYPGVRGHRPRLCPALGAHSALEAIPSTRCSPLVASSPPAGHGQRALLAPRNKGPGASEAPSPGRHSGS